MNRGSGFGVRDSGVRRSNAVLCAGRPLCTTLAPSPVLQYLRYALRSLSRTPTFTATAVLILGLGIGMASAVFTVFQAVVVRRLPVQDQDRIVELSGVAKGAAREVPLPLDPFRRFRQESRTLQSVGGFAHWGSVSAPVTDGDRPLLLRQATVTGNFFQVLGAAPTLGRLLRPEDEREYGPNAPNANALVAVLSYDAWRRLFGGDSAIIGRRLHLPELKWNATIVGVAPPGLDYPRGAELWTPNVYAGGMDVVARLAPGATRAAARARRGACRHREATVRRERGAGGRWWRAGVWPGAGAVDPAAATGARGPPSLGHDPHRSCSAGHRRGGDHPGRAAIWFAPRREHGAVRSLVTAPCRCPLRNRGAAVARRAAGARRFADRACTCPAVRSWSPRAEFCPSLWTGDGFCHQPPVGPWCFDALGQMGCFVRRCTASCGRCRDQPISEMYGRLDLSIPRSAGERVPRHSRRRA